MMKLLLLLAVVVLALYMFKSRQRRKDVPPAAKQRKQHKSQPPPAEPAKMLACAHCGVHLPQAEVLAGADGRPYCTEAHRLAGPR